MMLKSLDNQKVFLSGDDHLQLALFLSDQAKSIQWLKSWLPPDYDHKNIYALLTRLKRRQFISQTAKGQFQLSAIGRNRLFRLYPLLTARPQALGNWFTAVMDFGGVASGQVKRDKRYKRNQVDKRGHILARMLRLWGWGRLTRGVYLSGSRLAADALTEYLTAFRLTELVTRGMLAINENQKRLADRIFNLTGRNADWRLIIDRLNEWQRIGEPEKGLRLIRKDFLALLITEPGLPLTLLPEPYWMVEAVEMVKNG